MPPSSYRGILCFVLFCFFSFSSRWKKTQLSAPTVGTSNIFLPSKRFLTPARYPPLSWRRGVGDGVGWGGREWQEMKTEASKTKSKVRVWWYKYTNCHYRPFSIYGPENGYLFYLFILLFILFIKVVYSSRLRMVVRLVHTIHTCEHPCVCFRSTTQELFLHMSLIPG